MSGLRCGPAAPEPLAIGVDELCTDDSGSDIVVHLKRSGGGGSQLAGPYRNLGPMRHSS
jgi:hypothetical protein